MLKILIVEDEEIIRKGLEIAIDWLALGCVVVGTAKDAETGIQMIKEKRPDVVLTDICMPQETGLDMIKEGQKIYNFYSIVLTGYSEFEYAQQAIRMGVSDYLLKPVDEEELKGVLDKIKAQIRKNEEYRNIEEAAQDKVYTADRQWKIFEAAEKSVDIYVNQTYDMIKMRYMEKLSINDVAAELGVSSSFLSRRLKANLNTTFVDILNQYRVKQAIHLLNKGTMRVYEISDYLGFSEYKYFSSVFKKYTGATPTEFVKNGGSFLVVAGNIQSDKGERI